MPTKASFIVLVLAAAALLGGAPRASQANPVRAKDLVTVEGSDPVELLGYGLVIGLHGTGDGRSISYTRQSIRNVLERMGLTVPDDRIRAKNVGSVVVTATMSPWDGVGSKFDVTVSSIGDATSLAGGTLLLTELRGPDNQLYATAQGPLSVGGFDWLTLSGSRVTRNQTNAGRVPEGGRVLKEIPFTVPSEGEIHLHLDDPDFTVANRLAAALNTYWGGAQAATAIDAGRVSFTLEKLPEPRNYAAALAALDEVRVEPSQQAKIVINERTGTLVAGGDVRLQPATVSHGNLQVRIESGYVVAQPMPYSVGGQTVVVPESTVEAYTDKGDVVSLPATATADELAVALNALGVEPRDLIAIFQALKEAGALNAKMEIL